MYRDVHDLSRDELNELKNALFYGCHEKGNLDEEEQAIVDGANFDFEIPDAIVFSAFSGYGFVEDDFFCNTGLQF